MHHSSLTSISGEQLNMFDLHIWPWFERESTELPAEHFPKLRGWVQAMKGTQAAKGGATPMQHYTEYVTSYLNGEEPPYDIGL